MKPGVVIIAELTGPAARRIHEIQARFDPRMAAELPPHVTLAGSSGMGPLPETMDPAALREALEPITRTTAPITVVFDPPLRFMQSHLVVLPIDPHGALRQLHERIRGSGLPYDRPRFTFTPHCTLNFYRELPDTELRELLRQRIVEPVTIDRIDCYRTVSLTDATKLLELPLTWAASDA